MRASERQALSSRLLEFYFLEILRVRIISQYRLGLMLQVDWQVSSRPYLLKDLTRKAQGTGSFVWHRHVSLHLKRIERSRGS